VNPRIIAALVAGVAVVVVAVMVIVLVGDDEDDVPEVADAPDDAPADAPDDADDPDEADPDATEPEPDEPTTEEDDPTDADADEVSVALETVAEGFDQAWGLAFLPDEPLLVVTELGGTVALVDTGSGERTDLDGAPEVVVEGQGGLLDVAVHPDWPDEPWVYLTYTGAGDDGTTSTHLARASLDVDAASLDDLEVLFAAEPFLADPPQHYGSRVSFGPDDHLYVTIGDRANKDFDDHPSQDTSNHLGTTIRLAPDGSVPDDNPFVDDPDVLDEIYTYGHRNVQGMTVHPETGEIWQSEHGEEDGDELNVLEAGGNHGWPVAHTGCEYGTQIPVGEDYEDRDDVVAPRLYWECTTGGFAAGGMTFLTGDAIPGWEGDLFVAGLPSEDLARFTVEDGEVEEVERLLGDEGMRVRDVEQSPHDGALYVVFDEPDAPIVRLIGDDG
jgi:glucose/arabinose dehydrogenase